MEKTPNTKFVRKSAVIVPVVKLTENKPVYIKATGKIYTGKQITDAKGEKQAPADILPVADLETGQIGEIVCNTVLKTNLIEKYANHSYVGKKFEIIKLEKRKGKRYNDFQLFEVE